MNVDGEEGAERAGIQLDLWKNVLQDHCTLPHRTVIGNHDVLRNHPVDGKAWAVDAYELKNRFYDFDQAGWKFIVLDSTSPNSLRGGESGYKGLLDEEQYAWLEQTLNRTPATTPICIVSHIPILAACTFFDGDNEETMDWVVPGAWMHVDARKLNHNLTVAFEVAGARTSIVLAERVPRVTTSSDNGQAMVTMPYEVLMNADQPMVLLVQWETPRPDSASR